MLAAGGTLGAILAAPSSDYLGRKWSMFAFCAVFVGGGVMQMFPNYEVLLGGRFIGGLGVGACSMLAPQFLSENAPRSVRGSMVSPVVSYEPAANRNNMQVGLHLQPMHHRRSNAGILDQLRRLSVGRREHCRQFFAMADRHGDPAHSSRLHVHHDPVPPRDTPIPHAHREKRARPR